MFDLQVLAYQTDLTRVITFMISRGTSGLPYPRDRRARAASPDVAPPERTGQARETDEDADLLTQLLAYYLGKLQATPDGRRDPAGLDGVALWERNEQQQHARSE